MNNCGCNKITYEQEEFPICDKHYSPNNIKIKVPYPKVSTIKDLKLKIIDDFNKILFGLQCGITQDLNIILEEISLVSKYKYQRDNIMKVKYDAVHPIFRELYVNFNDLSPEQIELLRGPRGNPCNISETMFQELLNRVSALEQKLAGPDKDAYTILLENPTINNIRNSVDINKDKPTQSKELNMMSLTRPTAMYLVYPSSWEKIENDKFISPVINDWNGFEVGFEIDNSTPILNIDGVNYRIVNITLGKGIYTINFI